jgi:hypothetical protein
MFEFPVQKLARLAKKMLMNLFNLPVRLSSLSYQKTQKFLLSDVKHHKNKMIPMKIRWDDSKHCSSGKASFLTFPPATLFLPIFLFGNNPFFTVFFYQLRQF